MFHRQGRTPADSSLTPRSSPSAWRRRSWASLPTGASWRRRAGAPANCSRFCNQAGYGYCAGREFAAAATGLGIGAARPRRAEKPGPGPHGSQVRQRNESHREGLKGSAHPARRQAQAVQGQRRQQRLRRAPPQGPGRRSRKRPGYHPSADLSGRPVFASSAGVHSWPLTNSKVESAPDIDGVKYTPWRQ